MSDSEVSVLRTWGCSLGFGCQISSSFSGVYEEQIEGQINDEEIEGEKGGRGKNRRGKKRNIKKSEVYSKHILPFEVWQIWPRRAPSSQLLCV